MRTKQIIAFLVSSVLLIITANCYAVGTPQVALTFDDSYTSWLVRVGVKPGDVIESKAILRSLEPDPIYIHLYSVSGYSNQDVDFYLANYEDPKVDLGSWIEIQEFEGIIYPGEVKQIPIIIRIPEDANTGGHRAGLILEGSNSQCEAGGICIQLRVGHRIYVTIDGSARRLTQSDYDVFSSRLSQSIGFSIVDIDGDGILERFVALPDNLISYYKNVGSVEDPSWLLMATSHLDIPYYLTDISFLDLNRNGDLDLLLSTNWGYVLLYHTHGSGYVADWTLETLDFLGQMVVGPTSDIGNPSKFCLIDTDGDDSKELVLGGTNGLFLFRKSETNNTWTYFPKALDLLGVDFSCVPSAIDIDQDGVDELYARCMFAQYCYKFPANQWKPQANAGRDFAILNTELSTTTIHGTGVDLGNDPLNYRWREGEKILLDWKPTTANGNCPLDLSGTPLEPGSHILILELNDGIFTVADEITLTIIDLVGFDGLIGHWGFDDCDAKDTSRFKHDGVIHGSLPCVGAMCAGSNALDFNVNRWYPSPDNRWIEINDEHFNFKPTDSFSISAFVKPETTNIIACGYNGDCSEYGAVVVKSPANSSWDYGIYYLRGEHRFMAGYDQNAVVWSNQVLEGEWYHVVVVYQNCSWQLYIDGKLISSASGRCITSSPGVLGIGKKGESISYLDFFQGLIDEVRIYNRALSMEEINELYGCRKADAGRNITISMDQKNDTHVIGTALNFGNESLNYRWIESQTVLLDWTPVGQNGVCPLDISTVPLFVGTHTLTLEVSNGQVTASDQMKLILTNEGLIAHWNFEKCDGSDSSGQQHNGTLYGSLQCGNGMCLGSKAFQFGQNKWIKVSQADSLNFHASDSFSIAVIVKPETINIVGEDGTVGGAIVVKSPINDFLDYGLYYVRDQNRFMAGYLWNTVVWSNQVTEGEWYHVVVVYQNCSWKLYVNGELVDSKYDSCITTSNGALGIGRHGEGEPFPEYFQGAIDDVQIYNRVLSQDEIVTLSKCNFPPTVDAGFNQSITSEMLSETIIYGTASDVDQSDLLLYRWRDGGIVLRDWSTVDVNGGCPLHLSMTVIPIGTHTLTLDVSDGNALSTDDVILTIGNSAPHAVPSIAGTYKFGNPIILKADVSDFDGNTLYYRWLIDGLEVFSSNIETIIGGAAVNLPDYSLSQVFPGEHLIELEVNDSTNVPVRKAINITVIDSTAPTLSIVSDKSILWPPNHALVDVFIEIEAHEDSGGPIFLNATVGSNELENGFGDGDLSPDWVLSQFAKGTGAKWTLPLKLRSERSGSGPGREYSVSINACDSWNNCSSAELKVIVPHDSKKK